MANFKWQPTINGTHRIISAGDIQKNLKDERK